MKNASKKIRKTIRMNSDEFNTIQEKINLGGYLNFSNFAVSAMLKKRATLQKSIVKKEFILELNRIGNNLNQITRKINQGDRIDNLFLSAIVDIRDSIDEIKEKL